MTNAGDEPRRRRRPRTWPERVSIGGTFLSAFVCFAVAAALVIGYVVVRNHNIAEFENPAEVAQVEPPEAADEPTASPATSSTAAPAPAGAPATTRAAAADTGAPAPDAPTNTTTATAAPAATFPAADPAAQNFLVTGADNGACIDPDSPFAGAFGDRGGMGERSDTIMLIRVDPEATRVAVLSFPRDLWVEIADTGNMQRINSAYERDEPQRLADTIYENFDLPIHHYIQVDFCAFKTLVDAVGGVSIPFQYPARDENTGLEVLTPGCVHLEGEAALAYVRSRHYEYEDPPGSGDWQEDPTSDLGRISRQQDFLRRVLSSVLDKGPLNPGVARGLIRAGTRYVVTDRDLTPAKMMEFAGVMNDVDPASITTYQIEATGRTVNGNAVLDPALDGANMQAVLALFRGEISLADAPVQQMQGTTESAPHDDTTSPDGTGETAPASSVDTAADSTAPATSADGDDPTATSDPAAPEENQFGIVPPRDATC